MARRASSTAATRRAPRSRTARSPKAATTPTTTQPTSSYDGASMNRRTIGWYAPSSTPNGHLGSLATLRDRSRAAARNDGIAKSILDKLVSNIVGTGIKPLSQARPDLTVEYPVGSGRVIPVRQAIHELFARWTDESDADGLLDFYGQQAQATRTWLEGGDAYARLRFRRAEDGLSVPLQVQILEPELCPHTHNLRLANGNRIRAGIEFDLIGRRVAYWFHPQRPGDLQDFDVATLRRVSADQVAHLYDPLRPGQLRGLPRLTAALVKLFDLDRYDDATLYRQQLANMFLGFIRRPTASGDEAAIHPLTGQTVTGTDAPTLAFEPGLLQELAPGEEMQFSQPPEAGNGYADFMRQQLSAACISSGVPYEVVTGDLRSLNDRTMRLIVNEFRRQIQASQHQILAFQFCRPIFRAWLDRAVLSGALAIPAAEYFADPLPWAAVKWMPPKWPYIHPVQDVEAQERAIRDGFTSRSAVVAENGEDAEAIDAEQQVDNERADRLGLRYDSDGRTARNAAPAAPEPDPQPPDPLTQGAAA